MKKSSKRKITFVLIMAVLLLAAYLFYSRPMSVSQLYPMLTLEKCTGIRGYYYDGTGTSLSEFTVAEDSEEYKKLCTLLYDQRYRRSIRDLLPRGTRTHRSEPGDYQWEVYFNFENVEFPDGSTGSGPMLQFQCWYGELDIHFDGETHSCHTDRQEEWADEILDIIR